MFQHNLHNRASVHFIGCVKVLIKIEIHILDRGVGHAGTDTHLQAGEHHGHIAAGAATNHQDTQRVKIRSVADGVQGRVVEHQIIVGKLAVVGVVKVRGRNHRPAFGKILAEFQGVVLHLVVGNVYHRHGLFRRLRDKHVHRSHGHRVTFGDERDFHAPLLNIHQRRKGVSELGLHRQEFGHIGAFLRIGVLGIRAAATSG